MMTTIATTTATTWRSDRGETMGDTTPEVVGLRVPSKSNASLAAPRRCWEFMAEEFLQDARSDGLMSRMEVLRRR